MDDVVIRCEGIGKQYRIGERERYKALRDVLTEAMAAPFRLLRSVSQDSPRWRQKDAKPTIWALKDVSFGIRRGEVVGIIGRNGAGKTTLLKILSRITEPTTGTAMVCGRVGSLLEVGTGFHPELTGRENIFLNGAVLGMRKAEIGRKFDEIVAFSEIEEFLDTPVKHYSSGMYMRLAFSVAAHLETEILAIDEVLAVGDVAFQKKCLGKMQDVTSQGRTVLFVSHNMNAIEQLCERVILLEEGGVNADSRDVRLVVTRYVAGAIGGEHASVWMSNSDEFQNPYFRPSRMAIVDGHGDPLPMPLRNDTEMWVEIEGEVVQPDPALTIGYSIYSEDGNLLYWSYQTDQPQSDWPSMVGRVRIRSRLPARFLNEGRFRIELAGGLHFRQWLFRPGSTNPTIYLTIQGGLSDSPYWIMKRPGLLAPVLRWEIVE